MAKKETNPEKKKAPSFKKLGEPENWESGDRISSISKLNRIDDNVNGISVKIMKKNPKVNWPTVKAKMWIDEGWDFRSWLRWFVKSVRKFYSELFGKEIALDEDVEQSQARIDLLTKQLAEAHQKLENAKLLEAQNQNLVEFAKNVKDQYDNFQKVFSEFKALVQESVKSDKGKEEEIKRKIEANHWLLGLECYVEAKNQNIDKQVQIDLHVKTKYQQDRIYELKSPNLKPFRRKAGKDTQRLEITPELADAISELILYLERTNVYAHLSNEGTYGILKASGYIVIGYDLDTEEQKMLRYLNFHLAPHIQIMTYKQLEETIGRELSIVQKTGEKQ